MKLKGLLAATLLATVATTAFAGTYDDAVQKAFETRAVVEKNLEIYKSLSEFERYVYDKMREVPNFRTLSADGQATLFYDKVLPAIKKGNLYNKQEVKDFVSKFESGSAADKQYAYEILVDRLAFIDKFYSEDVPSYEEAVKAYKDLVNGANAELFQGRDQAVLGHLVQSQFSYDLLKDLNATAGNQGFVNFQGTYAGNSQVRDLSNFAHFGYKLQPVDNAAVGAFVSVGNEKTKVKSNSLTAKQNAVDLGLGLYAAANAGNFKFSGLLQAYAGDTRVTNKFDLDVETTYKEMLTLSEEVKVEDKNPLKNRTIDDAVNVNKGVVSFTGKAEYAYKVKDGLTVTPALFGQAVKTSSQYEVTTSLAEFSVPSIFSYQVGGAVAVDYQVNPVLEVGGDLALGYVKTKAGTYTQFAKVVDFVPPAGEEKLFTTTYKMERVEADYKVNNFRVAAQAKLAYHVTPNATVTAKAGYNYLTKTKAHSGTYGLDVAFKF